MASRPKPRGECPTCGRELALRGDRTLPFHYTTTKRPKNAPPESCAGSYQQPTDQGRLLEVEP